MKVNVRLSSSHKLQNMTYIWWLKLHLKYYQGNIKRKIITESGNYFIYTTAPTFLLQSFKNTFDIQLNYILDFKKNWNEILIIMIRTLWKNNNDCQ